MSRELSIVEDNALEETPETKLDVSIFEEAPPPSKPAVTMERTLDISRQVYVTLFLDEDDNIVGRQEVTKEELENRAYHASFYKG